MANAFSSGRMSSGTLSTSQNTVKLTLASDVCWLPSPSAGEQGALARTLGLRESQRSTAGASSSHNPPDVQASKSSSIS